MTLEQFTGMQVCNGRAVKMPPREGGQIGSSGQKVGLERKWGQWVPAGWRRFRFGGYENFCCEEDTRGDIDLYVTKIIQASPLALTSLAFADLLPRNIYHPTPASTTNPQTSPQTTSPPNWPGDKEFEELVSFDLDAVGTAVCVIVTTAKVPVGYQSASPTANKANAT